MNFATTSALSAQERVEFRRALRNLDNFLDFRFNSSSKLSLIDRKVYDHTVTCLEEIASQNINWKTYPTLWWNRSLNLKKIATYVTSKANVWSLALQSDSQKLIALERQCALLEKVVAKHNYNSHKRNPLEDPISFINPFRKVLRIVSSYPSSFGEAIIAKVVHDIFYDRLTSVVDLMGKVNEVFDKQVLIQVSGTSSLLSSQRIIHLVSVVPKQLFKKMSQEPQFLFDPSDNHLRENHQVVEVNYDDPDPNVLAILLFNAGKEQSLSHVYEQGFVSGRTYGYSEAIQKIQFLLSGK